ncbi:MULTISPECIES: hypothetical protein [Gammaproteobacteria]|uniref:hypothetical protein n=1 Tax=Gammaproteobacteria TaxID=1236 RepID=UPI000DD00939|nr:MULTISPECIES: hypothetical protein [Gammaproteobacteria]RTE86961.1 hypothetical protein DQX04_00800 [Aliidiomarina sp. B3213]TCZ93249.1 hypothetical protein EYQ95_04500 [Lysobacter sp. N42]
MHEYFKKFGFGFFWGGGFIVASLLVFALYMVFGERKVSEIAEEFYRADMLEQLNEKWIINYDIEVLNIYKLENQLRITASVQSHSDELSYIPRTAFDVFSSDGDFITKCNYSYNRSTAIENKIVYLEATCDVSALQAEQANYAVGEFIF